MRLTFADSALAEMCNCKQLMFAQWGEEGCACVTERLLQLAATADLSEIETLPYASVEAGSKGSVRIHFGEGEVLVDGVVLLEDGGAANASVRGRLRIVAVDVAKEGGRR